MNAKKLIVQAESSEQDSEEENEGPRSSGESDVEDNEIPHESPEDDTNEVANAGWADAISKILKSKPKGKSLVLSKAKKLTDVKKKVIVKPAGFEVETTEGEVKEETVKEEIPLSEQPAKKKKRELPKVRVKPNILEKDRERLLQKIATKGVVHLFNAVRNQQKDLSQKLQEAGPLEVRKEKVMKNIDKRAFLDVLMGEKSQRIDESLETTKKEKGRDTQKEQIWSVLRDDFMMGAKMKDWDKQMETEVEKEMEIESD